MQDDDKPIWNLLCNAQLYLEGKDKCIAAGSSICLFKLEGEGARKRGYGVKD